MSVTREDVQRWIREEVRRIFDAGLMYTEQAEKKPLKPEPQTKSQSTFSAEVMEYCDLSGTPANSIKPKAYIYDRKVWSRINTELKAQGFKWVSDEKNSRWTPLDNG